MKITKRQLRRIIKEEKAKLQEIQSPGLESIDIVHNYLDEILEGVLADLSPAELEQIAAAQTGHDFDEATQSLARIALAQIGSQYSDYRGG